MRIKLTPNLKKLADNVGKAYLTGKNIEPYVQVFWVQAQREFPELEGKKGRCDSKRGEIIVD
jgi:hypothetical protein